MLAFTFEASIGEVVEEVGAQARAAGGEALDDAAARPSRLLKVWRPSSHGMSKLLKCSLLGSL